MAYERNSYHSEKLIHERVAVGALAAVVRGIVEFDRDDRMQCYLIAQHEVHVLASHAVERALVDLSMRNPHEIANADLEKNDEGVPDRVLQNVVEGGLGRRQERLPPIRKGDWRDLRSDRCD